MPGTVVWAHIPYDDTHAEKTRPAVVESISGRDVTLLPATTSASRRRFADLYIELTDLAAAGLHRPTGIRRRPVTIDLIEVLGISGSLGDDDHDRLFAANHGYAAIGDAA